MIEYEVVRSLYLEPLESADPREEPIKLRLEVLWSWKTGAYHSRLFRLETYDVRASFGSQEVWGKEILIRDGLQGTDEIWAGTADELIDLVLQRLPYPRRPQPRESSDRGPRSG